MTNVISNQDDIIDSRDVIARAQELRAKATHWTAGFNMPGYMPDSEPVGFETWAEARDYLASELERACDETGDVHEGEEYFSASKSMAAFPDDKDEDFGRTIEKYHWWIVKDECDNLDDDERNELSELAELCDQADGYCEDWEHGATLIRDCYFEDYARELAEDCGMVPDGIAWPLTCIDWKQAARELRMDYTSVEFNGVTYWVR